MNDLSGPITTAIRKKVSEIVSYLNTYVIVDVTSTTGILVSSVDAGATGGPNIDIYRNSASPAAADILGVITFNGEDSLSNKESYAYIQAAIASPTATAEEGVFQVYTKVAGAYPTLPNAQISSTAINAVREADGAEGATLQMTQISASPANADRVGMVKFVGLDSGLASQEYAQISGDVAVVTAGAEDGCISMRVAIAGTVTKVAEFSKNGLVIAAAGGYHAISVSCAAQTEIDLCEIISTTAVATAVVMNALNVKMTASGTSSVNMFEVGRFTLSSAVRVGNWANAIVGKVDLTTAGYATGIVGAICAEVDFPSEGVTGGSGQYHCFQAEMNIAGTTGGVPKSFLNMNLWGAEKTEFDTDGFIFDIQGIADHSTGKVFQANNNTATHALRIRINSEAYYMLLSETSD